MLLTFCMCYWQWCQPLARLLKLLIIDECTCKSIMQKTREACGKQTHEQTMTEMSIDTYLIWLWTVSFMSLQCAESCLFVIYCNGFVSGLRLFMSVQPKKWSNQLYIIDTTIKIRHFSGMSVDSHRQMQIIIAVVKEEVSLPSSTTTYKFFKAVVRGSSFMSYKKQGDEQVYLRGSAAKPHATWQNHFYQHTETRTSTSTLHI